MRRARAAGQALVEVALGLLVFVTVLLFGIHFAELGWLGAKLHEANAAAVWDSTAYRAYSFGQWHDSARIAVPAAQREAARYADWDGRASVARSAPTLALTRAGPLEVACERPLGLGWAMPALAPRRLSETGGAACTAAADVNPLRIPTAFVEGGRGAMFEAGHLERSRYALCGTGSLTAGACGKVALLLGDHALNQGIEQGECVLTRSSPTSCAGNPHFYAVTHDTWNQTMQLTAGWADGWTGAPERWTRRIAPGVPNGRVTGFYLSFRGEESGFNEPVRRGGVWQTSPMDSVLSIGVPAYRLAYSAKQSCAAGGGGYCWLGRYPCN